MEADDVFDSVTWETPTVSNGYDTGFVDATEDAGLGGAGAAAAVSSGKGPGFRHLQDEGGPAPHEPKWEGYLIATVKEPIKELDGTKDVFVSYQVQAKVRAVFLRLDIPPHFCTLSRLVSYRHSSRPVLGTQRPRRSRSRKLRHILYIPPDFANTMNAIL
jgi:hypothetical protein